MALNDAAADAQFEAWMNTFSPVPTEEQKATIRNGPMRSMFRLIYQGIVANAVVSPAGSPTSLRTATGILVTGTGVLT